MVGERTPTVKAGEPKQLLEHAPYDQDDIEVVADKDRVSTRIKQERRTP